MTRLDASANHSDDMSAHKKHVANPSVIMYEDWDERPDGVYYKYKFEGETEWHEKLTGFNQKPYIHWKRLSEAEVNDMVLNGLIAPRGQSKPQKTNQGGGSSK